MTVHMGMLEVNGLVFKSADAVPILWSARFGASDVEFNESIADLRDAPTLRCRPHAYPLASGYSIFQRSRA
jgi:hypothetical protein